MLVIDMAKARDGHGDRQSDQEGRGKLEAVVRVELQFR